MTYCDTPLRSTPENIACDEALLEAAEEGSSGEVLRFWEPTEYFVVVGYANKVATEVNLDFCRRQGINVFRRCTGGGTVLQGPGCLNYSLILQLPNESGASETHPLHSISSTNRFILSKHQAVLASVLRKPVEIQGHTDLAITGVKFSGNAQRRKRHFLIFHGTFLLDLDISFMEQVLPLPSKQPSYRENRDHRAFLMNLNIPPATIKKTLQSAWNAFEPISTLPNARINSFVSNKYSKDDWNHKY